LVPLRIFTAEGKTDPNKPLAGGNNCEFSGAGSLAASVMTLVIAVGVSVLAVIF